ncbi:DUF1659 domain-containing protein [Clostridium celatum]|uniref:DUF1659 domain-containing protein n=1 Tax=Clostridium celatum TaxID=36834 RepID=UPI00291180F7|nr:DUF1659 domain-containing protein [Clostridium celatum]MDU6295377.1 DUF1659 domain-containing protein [Clostridium celatum]MDY3358832.1 DUF1659 domain-containing protein [Clostridium celatum]
MAVTKTFETNALSIEVEVETDNDGNPIYRKKSIGQVKKDVNPENLAIVVAAIEDILDKNTRYFYLTEVSKFQG